MLYLPLQYSQPALSLLKSWWWSAWITVRLLHFPNIHADCVYIIYGENTYIQSGVGRGSRCAYLCICVFRGFREKDLKQRSDLLLFPYSEVPLWLAAVVLPSTLAMFGSSKHLAFLPALFFFSQIVWVSLFVSGWECSLFKEKRSYCFKLLCGPGKESRGGEMLNLSGCARRKLLSLEISSLCSWLGDIVYALTGTGPRGVYKTCFQTHFVLGIGAWTVLTVFSVLPEQPPKEREAGLC